MNIATFIAHNIEQILVEWEAFATSFGAVADKMSSLELRDHAKQILEFVVKDIQSSQTAEQTEAKSHGHTAKAASEDSASMTHGKLRYASGFTLLQLIAEYRALRASVLRQWQQAAGAYCEDALQEVMRFNEAIDQSLAEAAVAYSNKVNETRDVFLAILGHDLRSPLAASALAGEYLSRPGVFEDKVQKIGDRVKRSAATMSSMVNDLLELARTQLGEGIPIHRKDCDLLEVCRWAVEDANAAHPRVQFEITTRGDLRGLFDNIRLQQVVTNLANNAAQYGTPGRPVLLEVSGKSDKVIIKIKNEGPVIPEAAKLRIFTSLVQLAENGESTRPRSSLGLGLFIAKQITVAHGGKLDVTSDEVNGTIFTAEIPR